MSKKTRKRLTHKGLFDRVAAPDSTSGRNPNVPIILYDTKPNQRFPIGSQVIPIDSRHLKLRGIVVGHAAEDRLYIQWPNEISQEDTSDVVGFQEVADLLSNSHLGDEIKKRTASSHDEILEFHDYDPLADEPGIDDREGGMEFIPDNPDFIDGGPAKEDHCGELPSEQDPRGKIDDDHEEPEGFGVEILFDHGDSDMTDMVESRSATSSREAILGFPKKKSVKDQVLDSYEDPTLGRKYNNETEAVLYFNLFNDQNMREWLHEWGLSDQELDVLSTLREHQLSQRRLQYKKQPLSIYGHQKPLKWGSGTGITFNIKGPSQKTKPKNIKRNPPKPPPSNPQTSPKSPQGTPPSNSTSVESEGIPLLETQNITYDQWKDMPKEDQTNIWNAMTPYEKTILMRDHYADQEKKQKAQGKRTQSKDPLVKLYHNADLVGGLLRMPKAASEIRKAADIVSSAKETADQVDEITEQAIKEASKDLLLTTDHLSSVNNRIANRVASEIEESFINSLDFEVA